jgi:hypothetical protein
MKVSFGLGYIASLILLATSPLLTMLTNPIPAVADDTGVIRKVVLLDLWEKGNGFRLSPEVTQITVVDNYAIAHWFWDNSTGETVVINQNNQWQAIASTQTPFTPSILASYGIPRQTARQLINRDRANPNTPSEQPPVANLFTSVLPQLQRQTDTLILLPSQIPEFKQRIYVNSFIQPNTYSIALSLKQNCDGMPNCTLGAFSATPVNSRYSPDDGFIKKIPLTNGIWGYFTPSRCQGFCTPSVIEWVWRDTHYRIALKGLGTDVNQAEAMMVNMANSAIEAGPR